MLSWMMSSRFQTKILSDYLHFRNKFLKSISSLENYFFIASIFLHITPVESQLVHTGVFYFSLDSRHMYSTLHTETLHLHLPNTNVEPLFWLTLWHLGQRQSYTCTEFILLLTDSASLPKWCMLGLLIKLPSPSPCECGTDSLGPFITCVCADSYTVSPLCIYMGWIWGCGATGSNIAVPPLSTSLLCSLFLLCCGFFCLCLCTFCPLAPFSPLLSSIKSITYLSFSCFYFSSSGIHGLL